MNAMLIYNRNFMRIMLSGASMILLLLTIAVVMMTGCTGLQTYSNVAHPGDTVSMAIHRQDLRKNQVTIVITDSSGATQSFAGGDPMVRGWINVYPDPVSSLLVGRETNQNFGINANTFGWIVDLQTNREKDIYETTVFLDLPMNLSAGIATIDVQVGGVSILPQLITLDVLPTISGPHPFDIDEQSGGLSTKQFRNMERGPHYTITFSGTTIPAALELEFSHDPDRENGGNGQAYVINPRGDIKNIAWTDTGTTMRVISMSAWSKTAEDIAGTTSNDVLANLPTFERFKFYVAGAITGLTLTGLNAYDLNGNPVSGVSALVKYSQN